MPVNLDPNRNGLKETNEPSLESVNYDGDYDYPDRKDYSPGSDLHDRLVEEVMDRANESFRYMSQHHDDWREVDDVLRSYVRPERKKRRRKSGSDDDKKGSEKERRYKELVMPYSFANMETLLTYMTTAFLRDPIFEYQGVSPDDKVGARLMQQVINLHTRRNHVGLNMHTMWRDAFAYGFGAVSPRWSKKFGKKTLKKELGVIDKIRGLFIKQGEEKTTSERELIFEGNDLDNIDPYKYLPDPNTPIHEPQKAEWQGWIDRTNYKQLRSQEANGDMLFNVKYLKHFDPRSSLLMAKGDKRDHDRDRQPERSTMSKNEPVDVVWMYVDLIPQRWELGDKDHPEKWMFGVAGEKVLIAAEPVGMTHGEFPVLNAVPDYDGHSASPISRMGLINDMQTLVDFMYTSHIQNKRRAINNQFVVDPTKVNIFDLKDQKPGKIIRTRRASFGSDAVQTGIKQLNVQDVTQGHIQDAQILQNMMQQATGASDSLQGQIGRRTTRVSASEIQGTRQSGLARLERVAQIISMQAMQPIAYQFAHNAQQFMEQEQFVEVTGKLREALQQSRGGEPNRGRVSVNPFDILVDYDVIPNDGTIPGQEDGELWVNLYQILSQNPKVAQNFDMVRIFKHTARQLGADSVEDFELDDDQETQVPPEPQVMSDEQVQEEVRKGNLVPSEPQGDGQPTRQQAPAPPTG